MATGLENLWIYKLAEETKMNILKSDCKNLISDNIANEIGEQYTTLLKGTNAYIRFLKLNDAQNNKPKN